MSLDLPPPLLAKPDTCVPTALETPRFVLRTLSEDDATERYAGWLRDDVARQYISAARTSSNVEAVAAYIREHTNRDDALFFGIFVKETGLHIGNIKFEPVDSRRGFTVMGILIGDKHWRGKGVASEVLRYCAEWLYRKRSISEIVLGVERANQPAVQAYLKAGFVIEETERINVDKNIGLAMVHRFPPRGNDRLVLGTAQFGLTYGIANATGKVAIDELKAILSRARVAGITALDTAVAYGDSENRLGDIGVAGWDITTKLPGIPTLCSDLCGWVERTVTESLNRLKVDKLRGLLLHRPQQLLDSDGGKLYSSLREVKRQGLVEKIGFSVYGPEDLHLLWGDFPVDIVQVPFNIIDRRFHGSGWLATLKNAGVEVHARSIFLQGLLLMDQSSRPAQFQMWSRLWTRWHDWLEGQRFSPLTACVAFAMSQQNIDRIIVGVDSLRHLDEILVAARSRGIDVPEDLQSADPGLVNPANWQAL